MGLGLRVWGLGFRFRGIHAGTVDNGEPVEKDQKDMEPGVTYGYSKGFGYISDTKGISLTQKILHDLSIVVYLPRASMSGGSFYTRRWEGVQNRRKKPFSNSEDLPCTVRKLDLTKP